MPLPIDEPDAPLSTVTFAVVDLETTGGSPWSCGITEVGAVKLKGGECVGTFHTLVNPGVSIPPQVTYLTGITASMVRPAPLIDAVLPALLEFIGGAVIVGHNVRFDMSFIGAAADRLGYPRPDNRVIDTCILARRLVADEVRDCKLSTLSEFFRTTRRPTHRALDDATATGEVLHGLLERAATLGVWALDDLVELPAVRGRMAIAKLKLTNLLPREPGVYVLRDACGQALFVGAAANLRRHVRSYFADGGDDRRRVRVLLRELAAIDHTTYGHNLEAGVQAIRLREQLKPRFNPETGRRCAYVKLTLNEPFPRLIVVRRARSADGCVYLGPLAVSVARLVATAIETVVPLRRDDHPPPRYQRLVDAAIEGLTVRPERLLDPLAGKMAALAAAQRFESAQEVRDQGAALLYALDRQRRFNALRRAGTVAVEVPGDGGVILDQGQLVVAWGRGVCVPLLPEITEERPALGVGSRRRSIGEPLSPELADEVALVAGWLDEQRDRLRVLDTGARFEWPAPHLSPFGPGPPSWSRGDRSGVGGCWRDAVA